MIIVTNEDQGRLRVQRMGRVYGWVGLPKCLVMASQLTVPMSWSDGIKRWLGESEQSDKWIPCLIAALMPRSRREHVETITAQP